MSAPQELAPATTRRSVATPCPRCRVIDEAPRDVPSTELDDLREMVYAGLVRIDDKWISVLPRGRMLVRAISMVFDRYLRADRQRTRYSRVI